VTGDLFDMEETEEEDVLLMSSIDYDIPMPYLGIEAFDPFLNNGLIPLPILHPVYIAVWIYNRETDNPFDMDSPICKAILNSIIHTQVSFLFIIYFYFY